MKPIIIRIFLIISLLLNITLLFTICLSQSPQKNDNTIILKDFTKLSENEKIVIDNKLTINDNNYLFLGDSITYKYDLKKYYGDMPVVNSGINSNKTIDIMKNIKKRVYDYNPSKIFLLIGTNQLKDQTNEEIFEEIIELTNEIHNNRKYAHIYVESIYPVNGNIDNMHTRIRKNDRIRAINKMLEDYSKYSYFDYIDVYSELADEEGNLKEEYTYDALHLTDEGYQVVTNVLKKYM